MKTKEQLTENLDSLIQNIPRHRRTQSTHEYLLQAYYHDLELLRSYGENDTFGMYIGWIRKYEGIK